MNKLARRERLRFNFLGFLLICSITAAFLFYPGSGKKNPADRYDPLSGAASDQSLAPDELEPYSYTLSVPEIERRNTAWSSEAETAVIPYGARIARSKKGFSGSGYVVRLPEHTESALSVPVEVPATQHYALTICVASDTEVTNAIRVNGNLLSPFTLDGGDGFIRVTFYGVFLEKGSASIAIDTIDGGICVDYFELSNDSTVYDSSFTIEPDPCDPEASDETKRLYHFLRSQWGKQILTGQHVPTAQNKELSLIYAITGQLPAIRFGAVGTDDDLSQINAAIDWSMEQGGIVGLTWQWRAPGTGSLYAENSAFSLSHALRNTDSAQLASLTIKEGERAVRDGMLMQDTLQLLSDIDEVAEELIRLRNLNIPVLWRPLYEAGGEWYWWGGSGAENYEKLWELVYLRMTEYHGLHNLIWIWNGQSENFLVPEEMFDIASVDVYLQARMEYGSRYEQYQSLGRITNGRKMLALSECSSIPNQEMMQLDRSLWSYFGLWYGEYLMNPDGTFADTYYSSNDLYNLYNSELALSLKDFVSLYLDSLAK